MSKNTERFSNDFYNMSLIDRVYTRGVDRGQDSADIIMDMFNREFVENPETGQEVKFLLDEKFARGLVIGARLSGVKIFYDGRKFFRDFNDYPFNV